jgi:glutaredoxin 3
LFGKARAGSGRPEVVMYANGWCPYCAAARRLLTAKQVEFREIDVEQDPARRTEMETRSGRHTVPQIFIGDHHVGGFDDLSALERAGRLDTLLAGRD